MILIKGGRVIDPERGIDEIQDVVLDDGVIKRIGSFGGICGGKTTEAADQDSRYELVIDATGLVVAPGLVDVHVHFRDPGLTYKEIGRAHV